MSFANRGLFAPLLKRQLADSPSTAAAFHTTIAPTMLEGSPKENVLPQPANALINYRIAPWNSSKDVMARAKAAVGEAKADLARVEPPADPERTLVVWGREGAVSVRHGGSRSSKKKQK